MSQQPPPVATLRLLDPEMLATGIRNAYFEPCQISAQPALSQLARVICPRTCLDLVSLGPAMLFTGATPKDRYKLVFVLACADQGHSFNFAADHTDGYIGFYPPGVTLDAITPPNYANATCTAKAKALFRISLQHGQET